MLVRNVSVHYHQNTRQKEYLHPTPPGGNSILGTDTTTANMKPRKLTHDSDGGGEADS